MQEEQLPDIEFTDPKPEGQNTQKKERSSFISNLRKIKYGDQPKSNSKKSNLDIDASLDNDIADLEIADSKHKTKNIKRNNLVKLTCEDNESDADLEQKMNVEKESNDNEDDELIIEKPQEIKVLSSANKDKKFNQNISDPNRYQILEDYQCMLNLTDISYGQKGHNKFYEIKIVYRKKNEFQIVCNWGRVGAKPQERCEVFPSKYEAIIEFKNKFYDKTKNNWEERNNFKPKSGKYTLLKMDNTNKRQGSMNQDIENLNNRNRLIKQRIKQNPSQLNQNVKSLMEIIWDIEKIQSSLQQLNFDTEKNPLGKLQYEQIQKGYKILNEIVKELQKTKTSKTMIIELSNQFYTNIPQSYGMKKPPEIDSIMKVQQKIHLLDILKELDITNQFIKKIVAKDEHQNPLDSFYDMLNITLRSIQKEFSVYKSIEQVIKESHGPTHNKYSLEVLDVLEIIRSGEKQRYHPFSKLNNKYMLWHGSRSSNFVGILSEGLRIAPPDAPVTGYMFGKGIYFSDIPSKAANYCHADISDNIGLLILCEVALGNIHQVYKSQKFLKPPKYYHSVKGIGKNVIQEDEKNKINLNNEDVTLLKGQVVENEDLLKDNILSDLIYNEYIVYDTSQLLMKYIVKVKFNFV